MTGLEAERLNVAARGLGIARAAFEEAIRYAQRRTTFGKPIAEYQTIQNKLAEAMRIMGANGYSKDFPVERYYRDAPLVVIGGGTNELQRLIIARNLLKKYKVDG
jgi:alkylation response protein AidB-like acyl-CoA dehydrogenase